MVGQRANNRAALGITVFVVACVWALAGLRAYGSYSDAHNSAFPHVRATLSSCGSNGCQGSFLIDGRHYVVTGVSGVDGQQVTLYVKRDDPYTYAQAEDWVHADGPFLLVVAITVLGGVTWLAVRRRRAQTSPEASRS
ncbi:MAG: hypothetical protein ACREQM_17310 [Candidatus Dormibacteraceae bacterium]